MVPLPSAEAASGQSRLPRRSVLASIGAVGAALTLAGCGDGSAPSPPPPPAGRTRSWRMGFSHNPPRFTVEAVIKGINLWSRHAELAIIHDELPWTDLLEGMSPQAILKRDKVELVQYLRGKGLALTMMLDLTNGLGRESEARALVQARRSLTEPAVQALAREYALAVEELLAPDWFGLAAETNLIRQVAPASLYAAVQHTAVGVDAALDRAGARSRRFVSVQAEVAWGRLSTRTPYVGIAQDLVDFPFTRALGISSYPYFAYDDPSAIPPNYFTRLRGASGLPVIVTEGGWTSASRGSIASSPQKQVRYIERLAELLDSVSALAWFQLQFADIDLASVPPPVPELLPLFTAIGLTDADFRPKPALAAWDTVFARRWMA